MELERLLAKFMKSLGMQRPIYKCNAPRRRKSPRASSKPFPVHEGARQYFRSVDDCRETGRAAREVLDASAQLPDYLAALRQEVSNFISQIRTPDETTRSA